MTTGRINQITIVKRLADSKEGEKLARLFSPASNPPPDKSTRPPLPIKTRAVLFSDSHRIGFCIIRAPFGGGRVA